MLPMGMRYDYYLKIETMPHWYEALINLLDLRDEASSGWDYSSYWRPAVNGVMPEKCFYAPPGKTCQDMFTHPVPGDGSTTNRRLKKQKHKKTVHVKSLSSKIHEFINETFNTLKKFVHVKNSSTKLKEYYDETTVKRISKFAQCDLQAFGYPEWDGRNPEEYIRSLLELPMSSSEQHGGCYTLPCES
mmetsp:Transcript_14561/g.19971  ORF Transcript_14561/g.19971 Transcript_14561/m.19971 type:complete len:188 (+) Transcript_14561:733-1296(+)